METSWFDIAAMSTALVLMFATVVAKVVTSRLLSRMRWSIDQVGQELQRIQRELGSARSQKGTAGKNREVLERKKAKVIKRIGQLRAELKTLRDEEAHRRELRDAARGLVSGNDDAGDDLSPA
jgi:septal ring factor EnvC (AmiA/AmiB activator)